MNDEYFEIVKTAMIRIVLDKIPKAKRWSVAQEFKSWIEGCSKEQLQIFLDRLRLLTRTLAIDGSPDQNPPGELDGLIVFESYSPAESHKIEQLFRIGGEATAYYALALWRSLQVEELQEEEFNRFKSKPPALK